jgi:tetratricopeptide (TPR) repeat protein
MRIWPSHTSRLTVFFAVLLTAGHAPPLPGAPADPPPLVPTTRPSRDARSPAVEPLDAARRDRDAGTTQRQACGQLPTRGSAEAGRPSEPDVRMPSEVLEIAQTRLDALIARASYATALREIGRLAAPYRRHPQIRFRAAQCYYHLDQTLGQAEVRAVVGGVAGQFSGGWLLVERRAGPHRFLCCPPASAMYQLRAALDAGLEERAAYLLHARLWQRLGRSEIGLAILEGRSALLLANPTDAELAVFSDLALAGGALDKYLRYERRRGALRPAEREAILFSACVTVAEAYCQRGEATLYAEWLHRALRLRPHDAGVTLSLADVEWAAGRHGRAVALYRHLLALEPDHPDYHRIVHRLADAAAAP